MARLTDDTTFQRDELGLLLPRGTRVSSHPAAHENLPLHVGTYITYGDLTHSQRYMDEAGVVDRLALLSVEDCLAALAHIGTRLFSAIGRESWSQTERQLIEELVGGDLGDRILGMLDDSRRWSTAFCEQQLVHLARLVLLHADRRPHDDFRDGALYGEWITCLFGVTDLLDAGLDIEGRDERISWEMRQCHLNHHVDTLPAVALHHELYRVLWPKVTDRAAREADAAFRRHTGISVGDYFAIGHSIFARFILRGREDGSFPGITPEEYFSKVSIQAADWRPFFDLSAGSVDDLRAALKAEEAEFGPTTYGSLTFERTPLARIDAGRYVPLSMNAFQRKVTEGVFHILAEAAEQEGLDRRYYTSAFGAVFQQSVEQTFRRGMAIAADHVEITADVEYGPRRRRRRSSDIILSDAQHPVFIEVVSGPLRAATSTRGDLTTLDADLDRLAVEKARQLDQSIAAFIDGDLQVRGVDPSVVRKVWPVIVASHALPQAPTLLDEIQQRVRRAGWLCHARIAPLTIISAEDLFFCEGFMQQGRSFLGLIRGWKSGPGARGPFKNYLVELGGGQAPASPHFEHRFAEANSGYIARLLGQDTTPDQILEHARASPTDE
jgi:hypothetical protein